MMRRRLTSIGVQRAVRGESPFEITHWILPAMASGNSHDGAHADACRVLAFGAGNRRQLG